MTKTLTSSTEFTSILYVEFSIQSRINIWKNFSYISTLFCLTGSETVQNRVERYPSVADFQAAVSSALYSLAGNSASVKDTVRSPHRPSRRIGLTSRPNGCPHSSQLWTSRGAGCRRRAFWVDKLGLSQDLYFPLMT